MKRSTCLILAAIFAPCVLSSMPYYALQLRGGSRIYASDPPVRKGRLILFHRYPDGSYMSVAAAEVERVVEAEQPPTQAATPAAFDAVFIGSAVEGPGRAGPEPSEQRDVRPAPDYGSGGYMGWGWGGYLPPPRPPRPAPSVPSNIGPNGFPILAPPGSPGSAPPRIGPNGFPILAPPPRP
jgi:hypothetical protein